MKGMKKLLFLKQLPNVALSNLMKNYLSVTNLHQIANASEKFFVKVVNDIQHSMKHFKAILMIFCPCEIHIFFPSPEPMKVKLNTMHKYNCWSKTFSSKTPKITR